jgi:hypothetical protein
MNYALSLIAHSSYLPKNESADTAAQFRKARLEEDGFVSYEESLSCFEELDPMSYKAKLQIRVDDARNLMAADNEKYFLDQVLVYASTHLWDQKQGMKAQQGFVSLANHLCTASQVEADDLNALKFIFTNGKALCSLGLEYLSEGDLNLAAKVLLEKYPKDLFRVGLSLIRVHQRNLVQKICDLEVPGADRFKRYFYQKHSALMLDWIDKNLLDSMGFEVCEILKGLFNRFPQYPKHLIIPKDAEVRVPGDLEERISFFPISKQIDLQIFGNISTRMALCFQIKYQS